MYLKSITILSILVIEIICNSLSDTVENINLVIQGFQLKNPVILKPKVGFETKVMKQMSHQMQYLKIVR